MSDPEVVRSNLLPGDKATVTFRGIQFRGLFYSCDRAVQDRWYEKARASRSWQVQVTYDPRSVDTIFLRLPGIALLERCQLLEADHRFRGLSWADVDDFFLSQKEARVKSATTDLQARANYQAQIQAVVSNAVEQAAIANHGLTKSSRLSNVQKNRQQERRLDSTAARIGGHGNSDSATLDVLSSDRDWHALHVRI